ncbi:MAG: hypothetical protein M3406_09865 [Chloroflexota bacterium]|nr:hypothetical protein [Chloroflexota bacterium]
MRFSALASFSSLLVAALAIGACTNASDPQAVSAAKELVPNGSEILEIVENTEGLVFESGEYFVKVEITDGGHGANLADATASRAESEGWTITDRAESSDDVVLSLRRDSYESTVYVWLDQTPVQASIFVRAAD